MACKLTNPAHPVADTTLGGAGDNGADRAGCRFEAAVVHITRRPDGAVKMVGPAGLEPATNGL